LRQFRDFTDLNAQARNWVTQEAGRRIHGTTHKAPLALFEIERPLMHEPPAVAPDLGTRHKVSAHRDCHVAHQRVLYSVPFALVGKTLWLRATDTSVSLYDDCRLVASHVRGRRPGDRLTVRDHLLRISANMTADFGNVPISAPPAQKHRCPFSRVNFRRFLDQTY